MKIDAPFLKSDALQFLLFELSVTGREAFLVGGCVRDAVAGLPVNDLDIATSRTPDEVETILTGWGEVVKLLPTGTDHGTWTAVVDGESFEITSFRKDVATDGRRATVAFADTMEEDAQRRDFTMNALYMDHKGKVYDPTGEGLRDLMARQVRFVGEAEERCKEDYLRILRLFRFHAKYGKGPMDSAAFWAAHNCASGLHAVSGERKWEELKKLLSTHDPMDALYEMDRSGVLDVILPNRSGVHKVAEVIAVERGASMAPRMEARLVALMGRTADAVVMPFPVSNAEQSYLTGLAENWTRGPAKAAYLLKDPTQARDCYVLQKAAHHLPWENPEAELDRGMKAECPLKARHLMQSGVEPGKAMGDALKAADRAFVRSNLLSNLGELSDIFEVRNLLARSCQPA